MKLFGNSRNAARAGKKAKKGKRTLIALLSVLLILAGACIWFFGFFIEAPELKNPIDVTITNDPEFTNTPNTENEGKKQKDGYYNILLAGTDNDGLRTDTIMLARLDTKNHTVALMSIPRDTMIQTSKGVSKINSVYGVYGGGKRGMEALMLEVEDLLGFMPNGYALINLDAFIELVDVIGGVYFDVPQDMYHNDPTQNLYINLQEGYQLLDGNKAMQLVRFRGYNSADIERTHVQQQFLITVAKQCLTLSNLGNIDDYCDIFARNVTTNYTTGNLFYFAQELMHCDFNQMQTYTLEGVSNKIGGVDYYKLNESYIKQVVDTDFYPYTD